jgi:ABC-type antimicrobial peptide transport system permease subunit
MDSNVTISLPLKVSLEGAEFITIFLNTILGTIIAFLGILSVQLIYSLMLSDVDEKTYEFGMLRALGFNTKNVVVLIIQSAFTFAIPGLCFGLMAAVVMNAGLRYVLYSLTDNYYYYGLSVGAYGVGLFIGIFMPLLSNILPIQKALGKNLRASLDVYHRSSSELSVSI